MPFGATEAACKTLLNAQGGSKYEVTVVKNEAGYNDWTSVAPSDASAPAAAAPAPSQGTSKFGSANTTKSTYETPAERAEKQVYIIKQSSLSAAVNSLSPGAKAPLKSADVIALAQEYVDFVLGNDRTPIQDVPGSINSGFDDMESDVPY